jgi:hypothetical protein
LSYYQGVSKALARSKTTMSAHEMMATDDSIVTILKKLHDASDVGLIRTEEAVEALKAAGWPLARADIRSLGERGEIVLSGESFVLTERLGARHVPRAATTECAYCARDVADHTHEPPPAVDDDEAWTTLAAEHAPDCEWITTRAHRVFEAP